MVSWNVDVRHVFIPNWIHFDPFPCARKLFWLRSRVHALRILDQFQKRTEQYGSALVCTGPYTDPISGRLSELNDFSYKISGECKSERTCTPSKMLVIWAHRECSSGLITEKINYLPMHLFKSWLKILHSIPLQKM